VAGQQIWQLFKKRAPTEATPPQAGGTTESERWALHNGRAQWSRLAACLPAWLAHERRPAPSCSLATSDFHLDFRPDCLNLQPHKRCLFRSPAFERWVVWRNGLQGGRLAREKAGRQADCNLRARFLSGCRLTVSWPLVHPIACWPNKRRRAAYLSAGQPARQPGSQVGAPGSCWRNQRAALPLQSEPERAITDGPAAWRSERRESRELRARASLSNRWHGPRKGYKRNTRFWSTKPELNQLPSEQH